MRTRRTEHVHTRVLGGQFDVVNAGGQGAQEEVGMGDGRGDKHGAARQQVPVLGRPGPRLQIQQVPVLAPLLPPCRACAVRGFSGFRRNAIER